MLLCVCVCLVFNTRKQVWSASAANPEHPQNSPVCFRKGAALCFFFSSCFRNPTNARYRLSPSLVSKSDQLLARTAHCNSTMKFRNRDFPPLFFLGLFYFEERFSLWLMSWQVFFSLTFLMQEAYGALPPV